MPRKPRRESVERPEVKYFVPAPVKKTAPESPRARKSEKTEPRTADAGAKYFRRVTPLPSELNEIWRGVGPELPPGYEGAECCPDCSAPKHTKHAQLCIRNPLGSLDVTAAWQALRTKVQIFFGTGHPLTDKNFDSYMTIERQRKLKHASMVVMYDFPAFDSRVGRSLLAAGELHERAVIAQWKARRSK